MNNLQNWFKFISYASLCKFTVLFCLAHTVRHTDKIQAIASDKSGARAFYTSRRIVLSFEVSLKTQVEMPEDRLFMNLQNLRLAAVISSLIPPFYFYANFDV